MRSLRPIKIPMNKYLNSLSTHRRQFNCLEKGLLSALTAVQKNTGFREEHDKVLSALTKEVVLPPTSLIPEPGLTLILLAKGSLGPIRSM